MGHAALPDERLMGNSVVANGDAVDHPPDRAVLRIGQSEAVPADVLERVAADGLVLIGPEGAGAGDHVVLADVRWRGVGEEDSPVNQLELRER